MAPTVDDLERLRDRINSEIGHMKNQTVESDDDGSGMFNVNSLILATGD